MIESIQSLPDFEFYIVVLVAIILAVLVFKKVASCLVRILLFLLILAAVAYVYMRFFAPL